jgi:hypothetical protein
VLHEQVVVVEVLVIRITQVFHLSHQFKRQAVQAEVVLVVTVSLKVHQHLKQHKTVMLEQQIQEVALEVHLWEIVLQVLLVVQELLS